MHLHSRQSNGLLDNLVRSLLGNCVRIVWIEESRGIKYTKFKNLTFGFRFGDGRGSMWVSGIQCRGDETNINQCQQNILGVNDCNHWEDAGVICPGKVYNLV